MSTLSRVPRNMPLGDRTQKTSASANARPDAEADFHRAGRKQFKTPLKNTLKINPNLARVRQGEDLLSPNVDFLHAMRSKIESQRISPPRKPRNDANLLSPTFTRTSLVQVNVTGTPGGLPSMDSEGDDEDEDENDVAAEQGGVGVSRVFVKRVEIQELFERLDRIEKELEGEEEAVVEEEIQVVAKAIVGNALDNAMAELSGAAEQPDTSVIAPASDVMREYAYSLLLSPEPSTIGVEETPTPVKIMMEEDSVTVASPRGKSPLGKGVDCILCEGSPTKEAAGHVTQETAVAQETTAATVESYVVLAIGMIKLNKVELGVVACFGLFVAFTLVGWASN